MQLAGFTITNHVYVPERVKPDSVFEKSYVNLRWLEKRMYNDEEVLYLPVVPATHPHYREWKVREQSSNRLIKYLQQKKRSLKILEVGCGNGWLSHRLSMIQQSEVLGTDINFTELQQAARVFKGAKGLQFMYGDISSEITDNMQFDIILFSASIQYFPSLIDIIHTAQKLLKTSGEIHILDSHFYSTHESAGARKRTDDYYRELGFPEMATHYFHHCMSELNGFSKKMLYRPLRFMSWLKAKRNPFPWICIRNDSN